ncbi:MAG: flagellar biosynthetic protein FliO [Betaproteobacteria bacterium]|nr:flagellar biosynthetic protein FliO [Betaproteobacteria bacterium]
MKRPTGLCAIALTVPALARADEAPVAGGTMSVLLQVFLGLALVMGAIALAAWLARRYLPGTRHGTGPVRVVGGVMVGPKERVVVVEVQDDWIVVGVTPSSVNALHTIPRPVGVDVPTSPDHSAEGLVGKWLGARRGGSA